MSKRQHKHSKAAPASKFPVWLWAVGIVGILVVALAVVLLQKEDDSTTEASTLPAEISVEEAAEMRDDGAFILDVREQDEWDAVHIPGAKLIPLGQLESRLSELPKDQEIVVVCRSGNRSATGRDILRNAGFTQVTSMAGGMNEWSANGFVTE